MLERVLLTANSAAATGVGGLNVGGGIGNIQFGGPPPQSTITGSVITANRLAASAGVTAQGGGLFTVDVFSGQPFPVTLTGTVIEGNKARPVRRLPTGALARSQNPGMAACGR